VAVISTTRTFGLAVSFGFGVIVMLVLAGPLTSGIATGGGIVTAAATALLKRRAGG
jgi:hypothetical protein